MDSANYLEDESGFISFEFRGESKEYFKIWIVNIALSILTLGVYSAWAKVRANRYIYSNIYLNGANFEFNADPKRILYGRLIVVGLYLLFLLSTDILYSKTLATIILILFIILLPWLIRQAISFKLKSASYRNIHFKYKGRILDFYKLALLVIFTFALSLLPLFIAAYFHLKGSFGIVSTLFIIIFILVAIPIFYKKFKSLIINNSFYGKSKFQFNSTNTQVIKLFLKIALITFVASIILAIFTFPVKALIGVFSNTSQAGTLLISFILLLIYLASVAFYKGISDAILSNYIRDNTTIDGAKLKGKIEVLRLGFISLTNTISIVLSLGLLYPWAKMRYIKYKTINTYLKCSDYGKFVSDGRDKVSTIGEETMDFFDIDIGV